MPLCSVVLGRGLMFFSAYTKLISLGGFQGWTTVSAQRLQGVSCFGFRTAKSAPCSQLPESSADLTLMLSKQRALLSLARTHEAVLTCLWPAVIPN